MVRWVLVPVLLASFALPVWAEPGKHVHPEDAKLLTWLDGFGLPSAQGKRYVIVTPPMAYRFWRNNRAVATPFREGILLQEGPRGVTVSHGVWPVTYPNTTRRGRTRVRVERGNLERTVAQRTRFRNRIRRFGLCLRGRFLSVRCWCCRYWPRLVWPR